jgi:hypothetical protein
MFSLVVSSNGSFHNDVIACLPVVVCQRVFAGFTDSALSKYAII